MREVSNEFDEDYPNNQSLLYMMKEKEGDTLALMVMSDDHAHIYHYFGIE